MANAEYYQENRERLLAAAKARYWAKKDEIRAYKQRWQAENREEIAAKKAAKYQENRAAIRAKQSAAYAASPDAQKARSRKARVLRREYYCAYHKRYGKTYRLNNREKLRAKARRLYRANPEQYREIQSRRKARKLGAATERINFKKILRKANGLCGICQRPFDLFGIDFDHIVPLARGGTHTNDNIQATHSRCNRVKGCKLPEEMASSQ
jgi:5-methylcytosine-specific restriction endonuclease McrA